MTLDDIVINAASGAGSAAIALVAMWYRMGRMEEKIDMLPCSPKSYNKCPKS